jgi:hypothetical protein
MKAESRQLRSPTVDGAGPRPASGELPTGQDAALGQLLASYELPREEPAAGAEFWARLEPRLPARPPQAQRDHAPLVTPLMLAVGHGLWQGLLLLLGLGALLGGSPLLQPLLAWAAPLEAGAGRTWLGLAASQIGKLLATRVHLSGGAAFEIVFVAVSLAGVLAIAALFALWLILWLRPATQGERIS